MLSLQGSLYIPLITFYLSLLNCVNLNSALDSTGFCTPYPCNQPPQPPSSTGYSPYGNPPPLPSPSSPPPPQRSHCPPVPTTGCCNQPPPSTTYSPPYPYFYTPPYPYGGQGTGGSGGGQGTGGSGGGQGTGGSGGSQGTGAAASYYSSSVPVYVLMFVLSYVFVVL